MQTGGWRLPSLKAVQMCRSHSSVDYIDATAISGTTRIENSPLKPNTRPGQQNYFYPQYHSGAYMQTQVWLNLNQCLQLHERQGRLS